MILLCGCSENSNQKRADEASTELELRQMVLHQTRELIRYVDAQQQLTQERLSHLEQAAKSPQQTLWVPPPADQQQQQQPGQEQD